MTSSTTSTSSSMELSHSASRKRPLSAAYDFKSNFISIPFPISDTLQYNTISFQIQFISFQFHNTVQYNFNFQIKSFQFPISDQFPHLSLQYNYNVPNVFRSPPMKAEMYAVLLIILPPPTGVHITAAKFLSIRVELRSSPLSSFPASLLHSHSFSLTLSLTHSTYKRTQTHTPCWLISISFFSLRFSPCVLPFPSLDYTQYCRTHYTHTHTCKFIHIHTL